MKKISKLLVALVAVVLGVFTLASCSDGTEKFEGTASDLMKRLIINENGTEVAGDFTVPGTLSYLDVSVDLSWSSSNEEALKFSKQDDGSYLADVTQLEVSTAVTFTASLTYNDATATKDFKVLVSRFIPAEEALENFYLTSQDGSSVELSGWVAYMSPESEWQGTKQRNFYILHESGKGGFYAYQTKLTAELSASIKVGDPVTVSGEVDTYNGARQIGSGGSLVANDSLEPITTIEKKDVTNDFILNDEVTMTLNTAIYATLSGIEVTKVAELDLTGSKPSSVQTLIEGVRAGQKVNFVTTKYLTPYDTDDTTAQDISDKIKAEIKVGDYVTVSGFSTWYNGTYQLQMISTDDVTKDAGAPSVSDAEKASSAINEASPLIASQYSDNAEVTLPATGTTYTDVTLSYALEGEPKTVTLANNKLTITPAETKETVSLTITATAGSFTYSKAVEFTTKKLSAWETYIQGEDGAQITGATGVVYAVGWSGGDDNGTGMALVQGTEGAYYVYVRNTNKAAWNAKFVVNHTVTINGEKDIFNGKFELVFDAADLDKAVTLGEEATPVTPTDITSLVSAGSLDNKYQGMYVTVKGAVYDGSKLVVGNGSINFYTDKYFATASVNLVAGNTYDVTGYMNCYNNLQISPISTDGVVLVAEGEPEPVEPLGSEVTVTPKANDIKPTETENCASYLGLSEDDVNITVNNNVANLEEDNASALAIYSGYIGIYSAGNNGTSITFDWANKKVKSIVITCATSKTGGALTVNGQVQEVVSADKYEFEITLDAADVVTISNISGKQVRVESIKFVFTE